MEKLEREEIEYLVEETILYEIDDDSLDLSINKTYDETQKDTMDMGNAMSYYGATDEKIKNIIQYLTKKLKIDLSDLDEFRLRFMTICEFMDICNERYQRL